MPDRFTVHRSVSEMLAERHHNFKYYSESLVFNAISSRYSVEIC